MPEENKQPNPEDILMSWESREYYYAERSPAWYVGGLIVFALLLAYAVLTGSWTMAIAVGLMGAVIYLYSHEKPALSEVFVTKLGVHFRKYFYPYREIKSFWFVDDANYSALVLELEDNVKDSVKIEIYPEDMADIRDILMREISEDTQKKESGIDKMARTLKL
jgi:hypothetical protein